MIKFLVTAERVNKELSPNEYFGLIEGSAAENYHAMLRFMVNEKGEYLTIEQAKKAMRETDMEAFWNEHMPAFGKALSEAFVSPTNAGG
jgi:hypothetical protein